MANVSSVPASFIFLRGQGVKVTSVVAKKCLERNTRIPGRPPTSQSTYSLMTVAHYK